MSKTRRRPRELQGRRLRVLLALAAADIAVVVVGVVVISLPGKSNAALAPLLHHGSLEFQGLVVRPGQVADFAALVTNNSSRSITVERAALIPLRGFPVPLLVGVVKGDPADIYEGRGWPITDPVARGPALPVALPPGRSSLNFGVRGTRTSTNYAILGLQLTFRQSGETRTVAVWAPSTACVRRSAHLDASCRRAEENVLAQAEHDTESG